MHPAVPPSSPSPELPLDVLGIGYSCLDELLLLDHLPLPEEHARILDHSQQGGGMVPTAMVAVSRLGGRAGMVTVAGVEPIGDAIVDELVAYGVDVAHSIRQPGATSHKTVVLVDRRTGGRTFLSQTGNVRNLAPDDLNRGYVTGAAALHLAEAGPAAQQAARWAKAAGRVVCLDGTHFRPAVAALAPSLDYMIVSQLFAREFVAYLEAGVTLTDSATAADAAGAGGPPSFRVPAPAPLRPAGELTGSRLLDVAEQLRRLGCGMAAITDGDRGCWCATADGPLHIPAFVVPVVDTTGGGCVPRRVPGGNHARLGPAPLAHPGQRGGRTQMPGAGRPCRHPHSGRSPGADGGPGLTAPAPSGRPDA